MIVIFYVDIKSRYLCYLWHTTPAIICYTLLTNTFCRIVLKKQIITQQKKKHVLYTPQLFISLTDITESEYVLEILIECCTNPYDIPFKT